MTIKTITFQQTFPTGQFQNQKLGVEIGIDEIDYMPTPNPDGTKTLYSKQDVAERTFMIAKKIVNETFEKLNPGIVWEGEKEQLPVIKTEERRIGLLISDISGCNDLKVLETYKLLVKGKPELQAAYDLRLQELSK